MTTSDLISDLRTMGPQDLNVTLQFLADYIYEARLASGQRIADVMDCKQWLEELAAEVKRR